VAITTAARSCSISPTGYDVPGITLKQRRLAAANSKWRVYLDHIVALRHPLTDAPAYASVEEMAADLEIVAQSLKGHGAGILSRGRLRALQRAVEWYRQYGYDQRRTGQADRTALVSS